VKYFLFVFFLLLLGCSRKSIPPGGPMPDWLSAKPFPSGYYTGIGHAVKDGTSNYIQIAKKSALEDLVSEIKVTVSSTSVLSQLDVDKRFHERYEQIIQTQAADEIEEFQLVDAWEDENNYWVYYRLSKERYREIKEVKKKNAVLLGTDFFRKGQSADLSNDRIEAIAFYFQSLRVMEKYLAEAIWVTLDNREILLTNEVYASLQRLLDKISVRTDPSEIFLNRRVNQNEQTVVARASYDDLQVPVEGLPLSAAFEKGEGVIFPEYKTDENGETQILLTKIDSREREQTLRVKVDITSLSGADESTILGFVTKSLRVPSAQVVLHVQRPLVYLTTDERSFGHDNRYNQISNKLKNLLTKSGFEFTPDRQAADLWLEVRTNTERGSVSGSIFITYLNGVIRVVAAREGNEIYAMTLDRIKGYGLDYERSSVDAYNNTSQTLENGRLEDLISTILQ
jgi:LPP20 lipoprotein